MASNLKVDIVKPTATNGSLSLKGDSGGSATTNGISVDSSGNTSITGTASLDGAVTINDSGADVDFRVESDTNANALFVEGSSGNVGIGKTNPAHTLEVAGTAHIIGTIGVDFSIGGSERWGFNSGTNLIFSNSSDSGGTYTEIMNIDSSGNVELTGGGDLTVNGITTIATADINGGNIDGTTLGSNVVFPAGHVLQVVQSSSNSTNKTTTSTSFVTTGNSATITPSSTSSKILVQYNCHADPNTGGTLIGTIYRGVTNLGTGGDDGLFRVHDVGGSRFLVQQTGIILDSPNTTSNVTYTAYFASSDGTEVRVRDDLINSRFILMEIAG